MPDNAIMKIGYGLYVITSRSGDRHNAMIGNAVMQVGLNPDRLAVSISKTAYSHDIIRSDGMMNICILSESAPFEVFERFGFSSGRDRDKLAGVELSTSENSLAYFPQYSNSFISLEVEDYIDLGSHGMFICTVTEERVISSERTMTYSYYHENVKPKPAAKPGPKGWVCSICGYVYEGEKLPDDFICPWCNHGKEAFEPLK